jgi:hypothetical protein
MLMIRGRKRRRHHPWMQAIMVYKRQPQQLRVEQKLQTTSQLKMGVLAQ